MTDARATFGEVEVYVWFEADPAADALVVAAEERLAQAMVAGGSDPVAERPRLLYRHGRRTRDGRPVTTWMEVWPAVPAHALAGWIARLDASAQSSGATGLALGGRHVEPFEPRLPPPAR